MFYHYDVTVSTSNKYIWQYVYKISNPYSSSSQTSVPQQTDYFLLKLLFFINKVQHFFFPLKEKVNNSSADYISI